MVGLQKRYAPAVQILRKRLAKERLINYNLHYLAGNYPEGEALLDLFIHPLDLVGYLFGKPEIIVCQRIAKDSYILMLRHSHIIGTLELSTDYAWTSAEESLKVCTSNGIYRLSQMDELTFEQNPSMLFGIPIEKVRPCNKTVKYLYARNNFIPTLLNNQVYSQGYFNEIQAFVNAAEGYGDHILTDLNSVKSVFETIAEILRITGEQT
jgi:virulence factor